MAKCRFIDIRSYINVTYYRIVFLENDYYLR